MKQILVISPHADDESYGVGGTILKRIAAGDKVHILIMTASDIKFEHVDGRTITADIRILEANMAAEALGASISFGLLGHESRLDTLPLRDLVGAIEEVQDNKKADVWYIPGQSWHQDHRAVFEASIAACRPTRKNIPKEVYRYELPTYSWNVREHAMIPNVFEDVTEFIDKKIAACKLHHSQLRPESNMLGLTQLKQWAQIRGFESHCDFAEAFEVVRIIR
jgi:LmbE family N-acetylglucosaminyl deacetylase